MGMNVKVNFGILMIFNDLFELYATAYIFNDFKK